MPSRGEKSEFANLKSGARANGLLGEIAVTVPLPFFAGVSLLNYGTNGVVLVGYE